MGYEELKIEGRNAVLEAFRSGKTIDKLYVLDGCQDGPVRTIVREARKHDTILNFVDKERLDQLSETKKHQGVIAVAAAYEYAEVEDILAAAEAKGEPPFLFLLDNIEDPHNLGAIIRTACREGDEPECDDQGIKGARYLVRVRGYGWYDYVRSGFKGTDRTGHRQRGRGCRQVGA